MRYPLVFIMGLLTISIFLVALLIAIFGASDGKCTSSHPYCIPSNIVNGFVLAFVGYISDILTLFASFGVAVYVRDWTSLKWMGLVLVVTVIGALVAWYTRAGVETYGLLIATLTTPIAAMVIGAQRKPI